MLLVQNLADREGKLHALKQEVTQLQSLATEFTAFQENFSKNHRQLEQEVEHLSDIVSGMDTQTEAGSAPLQALERLSQLVAQLESKTTFAAEAGMEAASVSWATVQVLEEQLAILASQLEGSISRVSELEATLVSARESAEAAIEEANLRARMAEAQASDLEAKAGTTGYSQSQELQSQLAAAEDEVTRLLDEQEEFFNVEVGMLIHQQ